MSKTVKITLPPEFVDQCKDMNVDPKQVLEGFIRDLCYLPGTHGSDERHLANDYFNRCYAWARHA